MVLGESIARIGRAAPSFTLDCADGRIGVRRPVCLNDYSGRWLALLFYPRDFSFVCPTELALFSSLYPAFAKRNCDLLGISVDQVELHLEWLKTSQSEGGVGALQFPLASDPDGSTSQAYGVWVEDKQVSNRGLFMIDPDGVLQYAVIHNLSVGRNPEEVLRVLDALQTGSLCPANWTSADRTIDPELALKPGRILGHYRIRHRLGVGTFGTVFAAWDLRLERMVALKVLKRKLFESRDAVFAEARAAAKVNHPHICTVYSVEEQDGLPLIVMEYLQGRTLAQVIAEGLPRDTAGELVLQIASGLAAAHGEQVVHGDLKPANVIVRDDGNAVILDFGLAGQQHVWEHTSDELNPPMLADPDATLDSHSAASPGTGGLRGTPAYMSPEQAAGCLPTSASEVFAFGLIWYEMLTGRPALSAGSVLELLQRLRTEDLGPGLAAEVQPQDRPLLAEMLQREPSRRPAMREVVNRFAVAGSAPRGPVIATVS